MGKDLPGKFKIIYPDPYHIGATILVEQKSCACVCDPDPSVPCLLLSQPHSGSCLNCTWNTRILIFSNFQDPTMVLITLNCNSSSLNHLSHKMESCEGRQSTPFPSGSSTSSTVPSILQALKTGCWMNEQGDT